MVEVLPLNIISLSHSLFLALSLTLTPWEGGGALLGSTPHPPTSGGRQEQERRHRGSADNSSGPSTSRGSHGGDGNWQTKAKAECWYYGKCWEWRPSMPKCEQHSLSWQTICVSRARYIEWEAQSRYVLFKMATITTRLQELVYRPTYLGQLPFTLFTEIAKT